ncbi:MAG: response regulator [Desulfomonile sp.]|jgi:DNA-binding NtrC family response regulator|nr:response regulator [Deltaproteobacteria bacterium]
MHSQPKVLIVDDEERFRTTMCKLLSIRGLEASTAGSGHEALEKIKQSSYDVLILDIKMPGMGGLEVLSEAKKIDPLVEVIIMTGYASVDTAREIMKLGAYDYLLKPYDTDHLLEKIENAYDRKTSRLALTAKQE